MTFAPASNCTTTSKLPAIGMPLYQIEQFEAICEITQYSRSEITLDCDALVPDPNHGVCSLAKEEYIDCRIASLQFMPSASNIGPGEGATLELSPCSAALSGNSLAAEIPVPGSIISTSSNSSVKSYRCVPGNLFKPATSSDAVKDSFPVSKQMYRLSRKSGVSKEFKARVHAHDDDILPECCDNVCCFVPPGPRHLVVILGAPFPRQSLSMHDATAAVESSQLLQPERPTLEQNV